MSFIILFVFGAIIGSFLNVCIYRFPRHQSIITPPSACPECNQRIKPYDLVPIVSYLLLGGKCRHCHNQISYIYPLVELITGILTGLLYMKFGLGLAFFKYLLLVYVLIIIAIIDLHQRIIPNVLSLPGIIIGLMFAVYGGKELIFDSVLGLITGGGILLAIAIVYPPGMGMGDVKLLMMIGSFLGLKLVLATLFIGSAIGSVIGLTLMWLKVIERKTPIPFGLFLAAGAIIAIFGNTFIQNHFTIFNL